MALVPWEDLIPTPVWVDWEALPLVGCLGSRTKASLEVLPWGELPVSIENGWTHFNHRIKISLLYSIYFMCLDLYWLFSSSFARTKVTLFLNNICGSLLYVFSVSLSF